VSGRAGRRIHRLLCGRAPAVVGSEIDAVDGIAQVVRALFLGVPCGRLPIGVPCNATVMPPIPVDGTRWLEARQLDHMDEGSSPVAESQPATLRFVPLYVALH
jgi:hypothetical protein